MAHFSCGVFGCGRSYRNDENVYLFRIPNPKYKWDLFLSWWRATGNAKFSTLTPEQVYKKVYICNKHFTSSDVELLLKKIKNCVPSLHLPGK